MSYMLNIPKIFISKQQSRKSQKLEKLGIDSTPTNWNILIKLGGNM